MSLIGKTIISEWSIVCDRHYLESVVESCFLAGAGLGSVSSGWISDRYGRKNTLMIFATIQFVTGEYLFHLKLVQLSVIIQSLKYFCLLIIFFVDCNSKVFFLACVHHLNFI
jgi:MFS family permease